jgi:signal transduction histidine kinase
MRSALVSTSGGYAPARAHSTTDRVHAEQVLALARVAMCLACVTASFIGAVAPPPYLSIARALLLAYTGLSLIFLGVFAYASPRPLTVGRAFHAGDFAWAATLNLLSVGPTSPFFVLFLFCILSAAFRWRLKEALITAAICIAVMTVALGTEALDREHFVIRATFIAVTAVLVGLLAENEKGRREQLAIIGDMLAGVQAQNGFRLALKYVAGVLMRMTRSETMLVAARELDTNRAVLWTASWSRSGAALLASTDIPEDRHRLYFFHGSGDAWSIVRRRKDSCALLAIDRDGDLVANVECELDPRFWQFHPHQAAIAVNVGFGGAWRGRVYLLGRERYRLRELRFVHRALCQLVPAIHNQYLVRRLRSRASAAERRRVARELHDGVIQSLVGLEMQTAALRLNVGRTHPEIDRELDRLQRALGDEAKAVRDVMHQIRPFEGGPGQFIPALREMVERFGRETGIASHFYAAPHEHYVPPQAARELARTLQEALTNVRRHAGATRVEVEFRADAEAWRLDIENDGRPFGFIGRLDLDELEARRLGPRVIKERVREMGANLVIESSPTSGVRLEISLPKPEGQSKSA